MIGVHSPGGRRRGGSHTDMTRVYRVPEHVGCMRRRDFLIGSAATAGLYLTHGAAKADSWGTGSIDAQALLIGDDAKAHSVLELFLYGGMGQFESFYVNPEFGRPDDPDHANEQWHLFSDDHGDVFGDCGLDNPDDWLMPWALDGSGRQIHLGPLVMPIRRRPDVLARTRVVVMGHELEPHEAAIPLALSGSRLGNVRMAGMGAHVQRYFQERESTGRVVPYSYVLMPNSEIFTDNLRAANAVGLHPGSTRPLQVKLTDDNALMDRLLRSGISSRRDAYDALVAHYSGRSAERHAWEGEALRSAALGDHAFALSSMRNADALREVFTEEVLQSVGGEMCGRSSANDPTAMGLNIAAHLLTHPDKPARYVNIVEGGLIPADGGGGYDSHNSHMTTQARNSMAMLTTLMSKINEPGENDPNKIDLDKTMIALTMEFGRTPYKQPGSFGGTNHWPYGYVNVLIGGPIEEDQSGIVGAIGGDGVASEFVSPSELRAALVAAMGIYPFTQESYAVGDLRDISNELDGLAWLNEVVLGRPA